MQRMMFLVLANFSLFWFSFHFIHFIFISFFFHCSDFLIPEPSHLSTYQLLTNWAFPQFFKRQTSLPPPEPSFDLRALQGTYPYKIAFKDVHTRSCLKIPHLVISDYISTFPLSLIAFFPRSWHSQLLGIWSTDRPTIWWLSDFNAWTPLLFLPLLISTVFCKLKRDDCSMLSPTLFPPGMYVLLLMSFETWALDQCMSGTGIHQLFKQGPGGFCTCSWIIWINRDPKKS